MSQDTFPLDPAKGKVAEEVQDAPFDGQEVALSITKSLELRVKTDNELRASIEMLIEELRLTRELLEFIAGGQRGH